MQTNNILRKALEFCVKGMCGFCRMDAEARGMTTECVNGCEALRKAKAALAAPPRNCDRFTSAEEAFHAWNNTVDTPGGGAYVGLMDWLFAPATEKEGGDK